MGVRLKGFDYSRPYFYMVTIKRREGYPAFGRVVGDAAKHYLEANWITRLFVDVIKTFHETWFCIEPITCFAIMPDHVHLLIKIRDVEKRVSLAVIVRMLCRKLEQAFFALAGGAAARTTLTDRPGGAGLSTTLTNEGGAGLSTTLTNESQAAARTTLTDRPDGAGLSTTLTNESQARISATFAKRDSVGKSGAVDRSADQHLFEFEWHDWVVSRDGQLSAFTRYIRENAERSFLRQSHRQYFQRVSEIEFLGRKWFGYGNAALLSLPVIEPFRCSRKWAENGPEWQEAVARASRIGPGGAGISTFMSPCEKACGHVLGLAGGRWIVLSPEGFGERWHPGRQYERFCADGRMLFLSLWAAMKREPTKQELYHRCHEMGDIIMEEGKWATNVLTLGRVSSTPASGRQARTHCDKGKSHPHGRAKI